MPLNPPSYIGQDVWYSPNVYVNKVQTALWQPPQTTDPAEMPAINAWVEGCELAADGTPAGRAAAEAYLQTLVQQGYTTPAEIENARIAGQPTAATPSSSGPVPSQNPVDLDTQGVQNQQSWSPSQPMSRYYNLHDALACQWQAGRWQAFNSLPLSGDPRTTHGLSKGTIVANLKLLCMNTFDKIKDRYPNMIPHSTWRPAPWSPTSQHQKGQAADLNFGNTPFEQYYDIAIWIRDNVDFDQLLLEYNPVCSWIHISWQARNSGDTRQRAGRGAFHVATFNCLNTPGIAASALSASGRDTEEYANLINLAGPLGLTGRTWNSPLPRNSTRARALGSSAGQAPIR